MRRRVRCSCCGVLTDSWWCASERCSPGHGHDRRCLDCSEHEAPCPPLVVVACAFTIDGPKIGRHVVAWRKQCARKVTVREGQPWATRTHRCHLHGGQR